MIQLGNRQLQLVQPLWRSQVPEMVELVFLCREFAHRRSQRLSLIFGDQTQEVRQVEQAGDVVDLVHTVSDVRGDVDKTDEFNLLAYKCRIRVVYRKG